MSYVISFHDFLYISRISALKIMAQIVLNTRKIAFFLSYHEIIWNKILIFARIINKNYRNEETDSYDYGNISHDGSLGSGTAIP